MANTYGLIETDPKKKFALQTANVEDPTADQGQTALPSANFSTLPTILQPTIQTVTPTAAQIPTNFKFTGAYEAANRALSQQETDASLQRRSALADIDTQYRDVQQRSGDLAKIARTQLQENLASRGLMMSGINAQAVGKQETDYNQYLQDLAGTRAKAITGAEMSYADILNQLSRSREGLFYGQQKEEEAKRLQDEKLKAEATAQQQQAAQQAQMIQQMQAAQEAAQRAAMAASAASQIPTYSPASLAGIGGGGGGGGGYQQPAPQNNGQWIQAPNLAQGSTLASFGQWVHNNLDANASPEAVRQVLNVFNKNGGANLQDLAWLIQQYPNQQAQPTNDRTTYGGRFQ